MAKRTKRKAAPKLEFNHAMVYTRDVARALGFYRDQMGFVVIGTFEHGGRPVYARLKSSAGKATIALHQFDPTMTPSASADIRLYFETPQLHTLCKQLAARGVPFKQLPKKMPWGWTHAYLDDPDGHEVSLYWAGAQRLKGR